MGRLTTHVLDTAQGKPGAGIRVELFEVSDGRRPVASARTNQDGRCDAPLLAGDAFRAGRWELVFHVGEYFAAADLPTADPPFLDQVSIRFGMAADADYHVPLLVAPWGYTTYRGS